MRRVIVQEADFDPAALHDALYQACAAQTGAIVSFTGYVRDYAPERPTRALHLEHYPGMCEREMGEIGDAATARWNVAGYVIAHRYGTLARHERIVFVATASSHRGDAFQACEYIMDALKTRAPFWKRESLADGAQFWVTPRDTDARKAARWHNKGPSEKPERQAGAADRDGMQGANRSHSRSYGEDLRCLRPPEAADARGAVGYSEGPKAAPHARL